MTGESLTVEYKREYIDDIKKTIIAFANTDGGELLIGVDDDGTVLGVDDPKPDVTTFLRVESRTIQGKSIISVSVQKGTACPYYLGAKGIRPEGVFVRQGASTVPATESAILKMICETSGESFEKARSLIQELTFECAKQHFLEESLAFGKVQQRTRGIIGEDGEYTNLGLLLSDQCQHTIKLAVFQGSTKNTLFKDPPQAVREALLNAVVHRDYAYSGSTLISIFDDRIEFLTLGGLAKGIARSDVLMGVSVTRNKKLAEVFYRLHLIEAFGIGMLKIKESYGRNSLDGFIEISDNAFKIMLPNMQQQLQPEEENPVQTRKLQPLEQQILEYIKEHGNTTRAEVQKTLDLSQSVAGRIMKELVRRCVLVKSGKGRKTFYMLS